MGRFHNEFTESEYVYERYVAVVPVLPLGL